MSLILCIETGTDICSVGLSRDGELISLRESDEGRDPARNVALFVDELLRENDIAAEELSAVAVGMGPGSYTGLRIGVSAAKGLAWALDKPCCGVSTLEAMAENGRSFEGTVICAMDARRQQIYNAIFTCHEGELTRRCEDRAVALEVVAEELKNDPAPKLVLGDGATLCEYLNSHGVPCRMAPPQIRFQQAAGVALVAQRMAEEGRTVSAQELTPTYLRLSQAERERLEKGLPLTVEGK